MELVLVGRVHSDGIDIQVDEPGLLVVGVEVDHQDHVSTARLEKASSLSLSVWWKVMLSAAGGPDARAEPCSTG